MSSGGESELTPIGTGDRPTAIGASTARLAAIGREIAAGVTLACVALPVVSAAGALAFAPLGADFVARGVAAALFCAVAGGIAGALARSSSFVTSTPTTPAALVQASFASAILAAVHGNPAVAAAAMPLCLLLAGLWQVLLGLSGLARIIKFTPYPVSAGFVSGIALLLLVKQVPPLFGAPTLGELARFVTDLSLPQPLVPLFGALVIASMWLGSRIGSCIPAPLVGLVVGVAAFHAAHSVWPEADLGPTVGTVPSGSSMLPSWFEVSSLRMLAGNPDAVRTILVDSLTLALLGALDMLVALRTAQNLGDIAPDPRRDLAGQGVGNVVSAFTGGIAVSTSINLLSANYRAGGRRRVSTVTAGLTLLLGLLVFPEALSSIPAVVLSAILVVVALRLFDRWSLRVLREGVLGQDAHGRARARRNAAVVLAVMAATALGRPAVGAGVGVALACLIFIVDMSRPVVRLSRRGDVVFSKRARSTHAMKTLQEHGRETLVLQLQGVLFFGNVDDLAAYVRSVEAGVSIVVLDMRAVVDLDATGANVLQQIGRRCRDQRKELIVCDVAPALAGMVESAVGISAFARDLDAALERAEQRLLRAYSEAGSTGRALTIEEVDLTRGMATDEIRRFEAYLSAESYPAGTVLCREGDRADRMWILKRGSVSVRLSRAGGPERRVASYGEGTTVGEMAVIESQPRSATVVADGDVECWVLTAEGYEKIMMEDRRLGEAILENVARYLSGRLRAQSADPGAA